MAEENVRGAASGVASGESLIQQLKELQAHGPSDRSENVVLATAVVLLEVAVTDLPLDKFERSIIHSGLKTLFDVSDEVANTMIQTAKNHLNNMRGSSAEIALLKQALNPVSRKAVAKLIDDLVNSHGGPEGFEIYLRKRFRLALGLPDDTPVVSK